MGTWQVVGLVVAIVALQAGVWTLVALRMKAQRRRLEEEVAAAGEEFVIPPVRGLYQGGGEFVSAKTLGVMALTPTCIRFLPPAGKEIMVPIAGIESLSANTWFKGNYRSGRDWLIVKMRDGREMAFMTSEHGRWMRELGRLSQTA